MAIQQPCIQCGKLTTRTRCPACQKPKDIEHNNKRAIRKKQTGQYSGNYKQRATHIKATATHCHLCGQPFQPNDIRHADHILPGNPNSPLAAAHKTCNLKRGNKPL